MKLHARAGGLGRDAVRIGDQLLSAVDLDPHVFPAGREDLLVEYLVALIGRQGPLGHVPLRQRRQNADHDEAAAGAARLGVRGIEAGADLLLLIGYRVPVKLPGRDVDLEIELPELGGPGGIGDRVEHGGVVHGRRALLVHEVQLDLQAHLRGAGVEHVLVQHPGEDLQRAPHLVPVPAPVFAADLDGLNVTAHEASAQLDRETMYPAGHPSYTLARDRGRRQHAQRPAYPDLGAHSAVAPHLGRRPRLMDRRPDLPYGAANAPGRGVKPWA